MDHIHTHPHTCSSGSSYYPPDIDDDVLPPLVCSTVASSVRSLEEFQTNVNTTYSRPFQRDLQPHQLRWCLVEGISRGIIWNLNYWIILTPCSVESWPVFRACSSENEWAFSTHSGWYWFFALKLLLMLLLRVHNRIFTTTGCAGRFSSPVNHHSFFFFIVWKDRDTRFQDLN